MTRLADFIRANREPILAEWEAFARTCTPASGPMDITALRDHADAMLGVIAEQLATPIESLDCTDSATLPIPDLPAARTAADEHGTGRARSGFTIGQMAAEYRALRVSVVRLWTASRGTLDPADVQDLTRFHEAVDQALAQSVLRFNQEVEEAKETFLAILGHDLRLPLGAIQTAAAFLLDASALDEEQRTLLGRIAGSATRSVTMIGDLLDFTRSRLGGGIPVVRADADARDIVRTVVDEVTAAHPECPIHVDAAGDTRGRWDVARLGQALGNVVGNAVQHGEDGTCVSVRIRGEGDDVTIAVHNEGAVIPPEQLDGLFNPMKPRVAPRSAAARGPTGSLGLGLYIAERIVGAHGGHLAVESAAGTGTTFTVHLPRGERPAGA